MWFARAVKLIALPFFTIAFRPRARGFRGLDKAVLCVNHTSMWDGALLVELFPNRRLYFPASDRLFHCPRVCRAFLSAMGAVRMRPGRMPIDELHSIAKGLGRRDWIVFFPEGRIGRDGVVRAFQPGFAMLALETGLPVVPVHVRLRPFWLGGTVVRAGAPETLSSQGRPDGDELQRIAEGMRSRVSNLGRRDGDV